ncbi:23S rRNA (adenine(2503)-C(2))-methyltransferase RlmN [Fuchsiella alkaliacetigena]|uniref:23S rRNA (adenine(2503)-C(2))-methyltransferase RlmN n=1 Tax=Fuchsiella alkaliacetigena TaxID=957042 RepID=UPI00200B557B|nr:23S rRNA (adenine(2503)-C(2))-methyltransferase RlmN [Fuchsiella alkaliacetigena]MCK8823615.1 23S rRNA (adenine(2503)-C(2))-methyltransferase RlmN [Fuchsiella alkaliacetigena]
MTELIELTSLDFAELNNFFVELGEPAYRAQQLAQWIYKQGASDFEDMTTLSKELRSKLSKRAYISQLEELKAAVAEDGTVKYLFELRDGQRIETVLMRYADHRNTVCISTQVGCAMDCSFCATGQQGLERNLSTGEIVAQVLEVQRSLSEEEFGVPRISNVVLMGMGEALANYDNSLKAIQILNDQRGLNIAMRKITLSTCGLVPQIRKLAEEELQLVLAISLHAAEDSLRSQLMPINDRYPLAELMAACKYYQQCTGRRITFEYALIDGVNSSPQQAQSLAELLSDLLCHVNLIPVNPVAELELSRPSQEKIEAFQRVLTAEGIENTLRLERGVEIEAACGQLKSEYED